MGSRYSNSRYVDVLKGLGFCIANDGPLPEAMRKALPTIPDKPIYLIVDDEDELTAIVMDETGVCWVGDGNARLETHGFSSFDEVRSRGSN